MGLNLDSLKKMPELDSKQKGLLKMVIMLVVFFVIILVLIFVVKGIMGNKLSDEQLKNTMLRAAQKYVSANPDKMPNDIFGEYELTAQTLASSGYMKDMSKYKGKNSTCNGSVIVFYNNGNYSYSTRLTNCDSDSKYVSINDKVTESDNIVSSGNGLYYDDTQDKYVFKGEYVNNFISFGEQIWRIVGVDSDGNLELIQQKAYTKSVWDNRYNIDKKGSYGINRFEATENSRIKDSLISYYNNTEIFTSLIKSVIIPKNYCVGAREKTSAEKNGYIECTTESELMGVGSIYVAEVLNASLDINCLSTTSASCLNYNYFSKLGSFWTLTPDPVNSYQVYASQNGVITSKKANINHDVRAVIYLNGNVEYKSGTGTELDPYMLKIEG